MDNYDQYTPADRKRMTASLKGLENLYTKSPKSLALRNGIAHIRKVLNLPVTVTPHDPFEALKDK